LRRRALLALLFPPLSSRARSVHSNGDPVVYGVMADFGMTNDISLSALQAEAESGAFDLFLHSGGA
jgi:hypothetical protein